MSEKVRMLNVPRRKTDEFYRYKMPDLIHKIEGKGNGIKTVIVNCEDIANALDRPASYLCRYFGISLAAATNTDSGKYIINGKHEYKDLMNVLDKFIDKFVLCKKCENPETVMIVKNKTLTLHCKACGEATVVPKNEKLLKFIFVHPPKHEKEEEEDDEQTNEGVVETKENPFDKRTVKITLKLKNGEKEELDIVGKDFDLKKIIDEGHPGNRLNALIGGYKHCYNLSTKTLIREMFEIIFDANMFDNFAEQIDFFDLFLGDELNPQGMISFLEEFNVACAKYKLYNDPRLLNILLYLYNNGYVIKSAMKEWYDGGAVQMSPMKQKAKEFIEWLNDQEEEEEEEEEEDDE
ncbi:eukaryotic translation initiation factor eif-5, putative [Entamoeba histolytica HM-1:IMSS-B]|uniref:Eukaryotic translation initiation factor eIF-5 n=6 Tax=Entamoeba histolytica TaxID=5759 RepID=C4M5Q8_ENTH1|nr:Eukaryotic translation initiation factor eIF-5 [Entamoeba histolytica HM-1:IMSS]EMD47477.1 eukaryotic translation initiation factor eIF5, putative [Entamoeba histolytica KU27]EMH76369.1 eukaryotic translation initiation factor eif-5, putative [Entamoeba histolytica HM-1:IMSS-B]EMS16996.1 eukaryotic translation initiation factor eif-5, putative [Entamoeba histolytica HM-3:IMSS]ENY61682.1 eukaryotic translation initiation factor eif-5, putative [Entamoeba histolytica HM-1:IMSS-A]GAT96763.1 eu|eukprot:XP_651802.1 Eukaryotic translation initiation factor eIF-5 [Entamoeba histolytica HM-1:IMSS]